MKSIALALVLAAVPGVLAQPNNHDCGDKSKPVLDGVDVVAFRSLNSQYDKPVFGSSEHSATYGGFTWYFSTADNAKAFSGKPEYYAPAWGGF